MQILESANSFISVLTSNLGIFCEPYFTKLKRKLQWRLNYWVAQTPNHIATMTRRLFVLDNDDLKLFIVRMYSNMTEVHLFFIQLLRDHIFDKIKKSESIYLLTQASKNNKVIKIETDFLITAAWIATCECTCTNFDEFI